MMHASVDGTRLPDERERTGPFKLRGARHSSRERVKRQSGLWMHAWRGDLRGQLNSPYSQKGIGSLLPGHFSVWIERTRT